MTKKGDREREMIVVAMRRDDREGNIEVLYLFVSFADLYFMLQAASRAELLRCKRLVVFFLRWSLVVIGDGHLRICSRW